MYGGVANPYHLFDSYLDIYILYIDIRFQIIYFLHRDGEFTCKNRVQCLPIIKVCDGIRHCRDASDESEETCKPREYVIQNI